MSFFEVLKNKFKLIKLNKKFFSTSIEKNEKKILVEYYDLTTGLIPFSYFANILSKKYHANIYTYKVNFYGLFERIKFFIKQGFIGSNYNIYKSFGTKGIIYPKYQSNSNTENYFKKIKGKLSNKNDILKIKFKNIPVGEYIYDEYLRIFNKSTIDIKSDHFLSYLEHVVKLCYFWNEILNPKKIKSVIVSHTTYLIGLFSIIAVYKKIPTYRVSDANSFYLTKKYPRSFSDFSIYPSIIKKIKYRKKKVLIDKSKKRILNYFLGNQFQLNKLKNKKKKNYKNLTILISAHSFTDAVHPHGIKNCFPDFFEWIDFLGKFSNKNDYRWLIKIHPQEYDFNLEKINYFIKKYPKLKLLEKNTKNINLVKIVDAVLTVYGTVGREFPFFNIPVINASTCGPHCGYNFNYHFDDKKKYFKALQNLNKIIKNFKCRKNDIFEFFYMRYYLDYSFLYNADFVFKMNEYLRVGKISHYKVLSYWLNSINLKRHYNISNNVKKFIESKQYRFTSDNTKKFSKFMPIDIK